MLIRNRSNNPSKALADLDDTVIASDLDHHTFWRFLGLVFAEKKWLFLGTSLVLISTACTIAGPKIFGRAVDVVLVGKRVDRLTAFVLFFLGVEILRVIALAGNQIAFSWLGQRVIQDLRMRAFSKLQRLPMSVYSHVPVGKLVTRVTNDASSVADIFTAGFVTIIGNFLVVGGVLLWLIVLDWRMGLWVLSVFPFLIAASFYFSKKLKHAYRNSRNRLSSLNAFLAENILGMRVVQLFNRVSRQLGRYQKLNEWYKDSQLSTMHVFALYQPTITFSTAVALALAIAFGGDAVLSGRIPLGTLVAFFAYVLGLFQPVLEIADRWNIFLAGLTSAERLFAVVDAEPEAGVEEVEKPLPARHLLPKIRGHIVFDRVSFGYIPGKPVLKDLSFEIPMGMQVGIVGPTGSGKSSLLQLLLRFYEPWEGRILIDGVPLTEYPKRELRARVGLIQQEVFLFSGSLRENLFLWRKPDPDWEIKIKEFAKQSRFSDILTRLDEPLQERGQNLSLGERQLVSFLRNLACDPDLWLLDEATSSMDAETENDLERMLLAATKGKTLISIAHRLTTVRDADRIIVLSQGKILEQGSHRELIKNRALYSRLWNLQSKEQNWGVQA